MQQRLQKILAHAGIAARRKCETIILQGRVKVNGKTATIGESADIEKDAITIDDIPIKKEKKTYLLLNKPTGYVTTVTEQHGMRTIMQLLPTKERVYPIGRLDKETDGLLLLTNDGDIANKLLHPRHGVNKTYIAQTNKKMTNDHLSELNKGILLEGRKVNAQARFLDKNNIEITIHEGRKHIIRKLLHSLRYNVKKLTRTHFGPLTLGNLQPGTYRELTKQEIQLLQQLPQT